MIFLEWQFGGENQMLLKYAYVAIPTLGIYRKELSSFWKVVSTKIFQGNIAEASKNWKQRECPTMGN